MIPHKIPMYSVLYQRISVFTTMKYRKSDAIWYPQDNKNVGLFDYYISCYIGYLNKRMVYVMIYIIQWRNNGIVSTHEVSEKWTTEKESIIIALKDCIKVFQWERERERERERIFLIEIENKKDASAYWIIPIIWKLFLIFEIMRN